MVNPHWDDTHNQAYVDGWLERPSDTDHNPESQDRPPANQKMSSIH